MMLSLIPSLRYSVSVSPVALTSGKTARDSKVLGIRFSVETDAGSIVAIRAASVSRFNR